MLTSNITIYVTKWIVKKIAFLIFIQSFKIEFKIELPLVLMHGFCKKFSIQKSAPEDQININFSF